MQYANSHQSYWASSLPRLDAWTQRVLPHPHSGPLPGAATGPERWWQVAPAWHLPTPQAQVLTDTIYAGRRYLRLLLLPGQPGTTSLRVQFTSSPAMLLRLQVSGHPLTPVALTGSGLTLVAPNPAGTLLEAELLPTARLRLRLRGCHPDLPDAANLPLLPASYVPAPGFNSFTTQVIHEIAL